ncbi:hypothetical protein TNCV_3915431, partial [Trichonephila clavipes]
MEEQRMGTSTLLQMSRFSLSSDSHHNILIWRRGSRHPSNIIERDERYGSTVPFMDDNAPCHRTVAAEQLLESERILNVWIGRHDLGSQSHRACMGIFWADALQLSYLTTSNDSGS